MRVQARTDCGPANREIVKAVEHLLQAGDVAIEQAGPAAKLLPNGERNGVLKMGAPDLDDRVEFLRLRQQRVAHVLDRRNERVLHSLGGGDVHRGGKGVVRRLRHVDVVIGMDRLLRSHLAAGDLDGPVGEDLVHVHVGLRARAGLPYAEGELVGQFAGDDFIRGLNDELGLVGRKLAEVLVDQRGGLLERGEGADEFRRHDVAADVEVMKGALRLRAPIDVAGHFDLAHAVGFDTSAGGLLDGGGHGFLHMSSE